METQQSLEEIYAAVCDYCEKKLTRVAYETFIKSCMLARLEESTAYLCAGDFFSRLTIEARYKNVLREGFREVLGREIGIVINVYFDEIISDWWPYPSGLIPDYTFDTFIVGGSNKFAHSAATAVAVAVSENTTAYNPLFIYGGTGLGKTHLINAIGHYVLLHNQYAKVIYISAETFTNEYICAIRDHQKEAFRNKYRNIDMLLVDDIQFLSSKIQTQEEFFHLYNALVFFTQKQIVITSDRPPGEIRELEERLCSRFESGLLIDINRPEYELRQAFLRNKAETENIKFPDEVIHYIAENITSDFHRLNGAFQRVSAYAKLMEQDITPEMVKWTIRSYPPDPPILNDEEIIRYIMGEVCEYYKISSEDILSPKRSKTILTARRIAIYVIRKCTNLSLPAIGEAMRRRDHTVIHHAITKLEKLMEEDSDYKRIVEGFIQSANAKYQSIVRI